MRRKKRDRITAGAASCAEHDENSAAVLLMTGCFVVEEHRRVIDQSID
jgi:hypothetical protein